MPKNGHVGIPTPDDSTSLNPAARCCSQALLTSALCRAAPRHPAANVRAPGRYMGAVPGPTGRGRMNASFVHVILPAAASANVAAAVVVEVEVLAAANGTVPLGRAGLRPRGSPAVAPSSTRPASAVTFTVAEPGHFVLEVGGFFNVSTLSVGLMVFVSAADAAPPAPGDPSVTYFGAGVHALPGAGVLTLRSDSTVYLAPGAVVLGTIRGAGVHNVTVRGPGILAAEWSVPLPCPPCATPPRMCAWCTKPCRAPFPPWHATLRPGNG